MSEVQSVLLDREYFHNVNDAVKKIKSMGFNIDYGIDMTKNYWRFRQFNPDPNLPKKTKDVSDGVKFILEFRRK